MVLYICENFHNNIWNSFPLTDRIQVHGRNGYVQCSKGNNSKSRQTRQFLFMCSAYSLLVLYICVKFHEMYRADEYTEWLFSISTMFKRPLSKNRLTRNSFCVLHIVSWYFTFVRNFIIIPQVFNLQSRHQYMVEMALFNVSRAISPKVGKPELQFMCSVHGLIVLYICVKFPDNISDSIRYMEQTQMMEVLMDRWTNRRTDSRTLKISEGIT